MKTEHTPAGPGDYTAAVKVALGQCSTRDGLPEVDTDTGTVREDQYAKLSAIAAIIEADD